MGAAAAPRTGSKSMKQPSSRPGEDPPQIGAHGQARAALLAHTARDRLEARPGRCHTVSVGSDYSN